MSSGKLISVKQLNTMSGYFQRTHSTATQPSSMEPETSHNNSSTPLRLFVDAKKKINEIFGEIASHTRESKDFIVGIPSDFDVVSDDLMEKVQGFCSQVQSIRDVLARDHMKVAFFGRTSNGKSSVINAMLREKVLPTGIGHTTDCFLSVEGSETNESYLQMDDSTQKLSVQNVGQMANALSNERICGQSSVVKVFWPKSRCHLLQNDVVLLDSPGIDVEPNLDQWIDKYCLDADVFVLVSNAESTLMRTEKSFFHKVSERLSKPNIFILNNRWDAAANEPEMEAVKKQHLQRNIEFLVDELKVVTRQQAEDRVFFVSAKEALITRIPKPAHTPDSSGPLAEGFQARLFSFENFERKFEECISHSAVVTKFEQHAKQGKQIAACTQDILDEALQQSSKKRATCIEKRKEQTDRLQYVTTQLKLLTGECKDKIKDIAEQAETKVSAAMTDEIRKLSLLVDQFDRTFQSDPLVIKVYKEELQKHLEAGLGRNLDARCTSAVMQDVQQVQEQMTESMSALLPDETKDQVSRLLFRRDFGPSYRLECQNLFADFSENVEFRFSLGFTALMNRFLGPKNTRVAMAGFANVIPRPLAAAGAESGARGQEDLTVAMVTGLASLTSRTSMGLMIVVGIVWKAVGWRVLAVGGGLYTLLYIYERLTWTNKAKERAFKQQFVQYASEKLKLLVNFTGSNLSHQIQQELSSTFARLCLEVDNHTDSLRKELIKMEDESQKLEAMIARAKVLRNKAGWLDSELDRYIHNFLKH
ncbi:mitofusin-2-like isoform X1 [Acanthaster planci]|uniref:Mitofusin-2-like isoform X1 n=1 Tax=Acanthaster planci TaxID=133434 RepID=A0A8B7YYL3_ACAPL|nr:mitofusin-2-like isoform X1 [Acanthaster planci]